MYRIVSNLIIYGDMPKDSILIRLSEIFKDLEKSDFDKEELVSRVYTEIKRLLVLSTDNGFTGNLWHCYITYLIVMSENPFSLVCEKIGSRNGSVNHFAKNDFALFRELFGFDFSDIEKKLDIDCFSCITDYSAIEKPELMYNKNVSEKIRALSTSLENTADVDGFFKAVTDFYRDFGVGAFGLNKAFRLETQNENDICLIPINNMDKVMLSDIVGYEIQKKKLVDNTRAFVSGKKANNVLLYGDSGTGKSTSIKAIVNEFYEDGLRMIEIYKHQFRYLSKVIAKIKNRNYKFIIYMDDLSFEDFETDYKFLKAVIEGGVETRPDNVLIYATSNRRHLIKETQGDMDDMERVNDMHHSDTVEEKLSLAYRFGVTINYSRPTREEFFNIVSELADKNGIKTQKDELLKEAFKWQSAHGGISGRTAEQFIKYVLGKG